MLCSHVRPNTYQDSLRLMQLSRALADVPGVDRVSVVMGTPANKEMLRNAGLDVDGLDEAGPTDLVIAAGVADAAAAGALVARAHGLLTPRGPRSGRSGPPTVRSLDRAVAVLDDVNLGLVSIPGEYVAGEVDRLLDRGIHAFVFSDNVSIDDEVALKTRAIERGLLVMGPDCGTGCIRGIPLGFVNAVDDGAIGLVGASGTGLQEVMVQIGRLGGGVSHAIGVGGRDLSARVGGVMCLQGLRALDDDVATDVIVLVGKPPARRVRDRVMGLAGGLSKPVVAVLLGDRGSARVDGAVRHARTLEEAARVAVELAGTRAGRPVTPRPEQRWITGLYTGGTLAAEAALLLADSRTGRASGARGHEVIDLGDDAYTRGRPHPMIDPGARNQQIGAVLEDPETAVLLLDVVLGYGAAADPAGALAQAVVEGLAKVQADGRDVAVVASVCGTDDDPQGASGQIRVLEQAGVTVLPSNAAAVRHALALVERRAGAKTPGPAPAEPVRRLLSETPRIVNIGLREFATSPFERGAEIVHLDWRPAAGGDRRVQSLLARLR
ncbi:acyl-CoA synthetase FdrA [Geodermatophilus ruber]|uniref:FdrA protein n=1 Tax=Geodermatophilus ruber TaxID=504800 RepID=A0A1I4INV4_9ACTN|nr:acyl-CoA synthetase FdrA [Geodermatophilus ruber]SFL55481.1 FdrA protein [Geodermatophilus ruber]